MHSAGSITNTKLQLYYYYGSHTHRTSDVEDITAIGVSAFIISALTQVCFSACTSEWREINRSGRPGWNSWKQNTK